jgi:HSP20 family protein
MGYNLSRFDPFQHLARFDHLRGFEDMLRDFHLTSSLRDTEGMPRIKIDVTETDEAYSVKAEIPGVKKEDIKVDIDHNQVFISAESKHKSEVKDGKSVVRSERYYGQQFRSFTLDHDINDANTVAKYQDGILDLLIPKKANKQGKKIVVG